MATGTRLAKTNSCQSWRKARHLAWNYQLLILPEVSAEARGAGFPDWLGSRSQEPIYVAPCDPRIAKGPKPSHGSRGGQGLRGSVAGDSNQLVAAPGSSGSQSEGAASQVWWRSGQGTTGNDGKNRSFAKLFFVFFYIDILLLHCSLLSSSPINHPVPEI